jgi:branched-chain amino acid transport system permease protein
MVAFFQVALSGLVTGSLYGLLALGITLIYRTTGVLNFAYGVIGATCACFMTILLLGPTRNFWWALALTVVFAALLGAVLERGFARPVLNAPIFTKAIATLALALVLQTIAEQIWPQLDQPIRFTTPFDGYALSIGGVYISALDGVIILVTAAIMGALTLFLSRSRLGIAMRATADDLSAARLMGVPVGRVFLLTWAVSAVIAALAGVLLAGLNNFVDVQFMNPIVILAFVGAVLGGLDSLPGALIGGIAVGVFDNLLALYLAGHTIGPLNISDPGVRTAIIFGAFVVVLFVRPQGLFGRARLRRV